MNVVALSEGLYHVFVGTEMCHDTQLNLTIVGREEKASFFGDEGTANLLAVVAAHWDVLQIGV